MIVRSATSGDLERLRSVAGLSFPATSDRRSSPDAALLVVDEGDGPFGYADVRIAGHGSVLPGAEDGSANSIVRAFRSGQLVRLRVDPSARRRGAGRALVTAASEWIREQGVEDLQLAIPPDDDGARRFVEDLGFEPLLHELSRDATTIGAIRDTRCREVTPAEVERVAHLVREEVRLQCAYANWFRLHDPIDWRAFVAAKLRSVRTGLLTLGSGPDLVGYVEVTAPEVAPVGIGRARRFARLLLRGRPPRGPGRIEDLFVRENVRGTGAARDLLAGALRWLAAHGAGDVHASVWARNERSLRFFSREEFAPRTLRLRRGVSP